MLEILLHFGLGLLGIFLYTLFKAKDYLLAKEFIFGTMFVENWKSWVWSATVMLTLAVSLHLEPDLSDILKTVFSIDLTASPGGFFMLGATINLLIKPNNKVNRRKKN